MSCETRDAVCRHCQAPFGGAGEFCCRGCETVYELLHRESLSRYYDLRGASAGQPVATPAAEPDRKWLALVEPRVASGRVDVDIQGLHCAACVWLIEELFRRQPGGLAITINPALGHASLAVRPDFRLAELVVKVERFGYRLGPPLKAESAGSSHGLLWRMGLCIAIAMNTMIFAIAIYAGLTAGPVYRFFEALNFGLSGLSVSVGGWVFIASAWRSLRRGILHLDLPIAVGVILAFAGSAFAFGTRGGAQYFDTLNVFIALMLVGRFLQERVLFRNRRMLLAESGAEGLLVRRLDGDRVDVVPCPRIAAGDRLLLAPGDLVPVDAVLEDERASVSLDWINGESAPRELARGETLPAGAFATGTRAVVATAAAPFQASVLVRLLASPAAPVGGDHARRTPWWASLSRSYVIFVLGAAAVTLAAWLWSTGDLQKSLGATTALLVVTCPCAFGLATPLAYELVQAGLRRAGLFVRSPSFLDRAVSVDEVVFDKTGTLTTGVLEIEDRAPLAALSGAERDVLYSMAARSTHPKSMAVRRALDHFGAHFLPGLEVDEEPGRGLTAVRDGRAYTLGKGEDDVVFSVDGVARARLSPVEAIRPNARADVARLAARYPVTILSGDHQDRVTELATSLGIPPERALGGRSPDDKAAWLAGGRGRALMIGDGLNDALASARAFCSGTPAIDRPFMPARTDFYFTTPGLRPIRLALEAARALERTNRRNLGIALVYNAVTVSLAAGGVMSPLLCAIVMPVTSLSIILVTAATLSARRPFWRS